jgi:hypothetical protein
MLTRRDALVALMLVAACAACKRRARRGSVDSGAAASDGGSAVADGGVPGDSGAGDADGGGSGNADAGALYRTPSGGFQVRFPEGKAPEVEEKTITGGSAAVHLFKVQYGTSGYIVTYDDFAKGSARAPQLILDGAREGVVETTGGTIDSEPPVTLDGHPGLDLAVTATTSGITMRQRVRVFLVDGRLYQLIVVAPSWSGATVVEQEFFDSFRLLGDGGP